MIETPVETLRAYRVMSRSEVQLLRIIRNECRTGFSGDTEPITMEQQEAWWAENCMIVRAWLFYDEEADLIGFGMLRPWAENTTSVCGVLPWQTGHRYGLQIMSYLLSEAHGPLVARARLDNPAAMKLHPPEHGWAEVGRDAACVYYRWAGRP